jgi:hypothetical protein
VSPVTVLPGLSGLADLAAFAAQLGLRPVWQELPPDPPFVRGARQGAVLARAGGFEWLGLVGAPAGEVARRAAHTLATRGRSAGVLVLDPEARQLALAVQVDRPAVLVIPQDAPSAAHREQLARLARQADLRGVAYALRAAEILEGEDAGRRFIRAFGETLEAMAASLPGVPPPRRRDLALLQLTRVLFLYFVEAKGWLDGRPDFLRWAVDTTLAARRPLHRHLFRPLFFGTLNKPLASRGRARAWGRIPFLNGGLFEPHPLERAWRGEIPDAAWRAAFDNLFERFHFTVHEDAPPGVIAPDMLGRVFEGLMAPGQRRASGAFYTPAALVARMVDAALAAHLGARLGMEPAEAASRLAARDPELIAPLATLTVLDPAVGSGAFLLGALERLAELQAGSAPPAALRRRILATNLFGVDRNPMAVRLAELRLWLAVIAGDTTARPEVVEPLPNLDGLVRQGDSLLDPTAVLATLDVRPGPAGLRLAALRAGFVTASGPAKRERLRQLRKAELAAFAECLTEAEQRLESDIAETLSLARTPTLFGGRRGLDAELRPALRRLRLRQREVRRLARRLRQEGEIAWFACEVQFADVLARGGFDLVLGNPPWVRAEALPPRVREALARRFRCWRGGGRGFAHQPDLALAFVERGLELLAPGGTLAFLLPAKLATAGYAKALRMELAERHTLDLLADLAEDPAAAFDAATYPAALVVTRARPRPHHVVRLTLDAPGPAVPQAAWRGGVPWRLAPPALLEALLELSAGHPPLAERVLPQLGVKTGANALFLDPPEELEPAVVRLALRGRDLGSFVATPRRRLFYPHDVHGRVHPVLPPGARAYAARHEATLRARVDYVGGPSWTLFRTAGATAPYRVVWSDLARELAAVPLLGPGSRELVPLNSCYLAALPGPEEALALAAWLNSSWLRIAARTSAEPARGGFARFNARVVGELPLPPAVLTDPTLVELAERGRRGEAVQEELDDVAARHLGLTPRARAVLAGRAAAPDRGRVAAGGA